MKKDSLKVLRVKAGLKQSELAEKIGATQTSIARYESNVEVLRGASYRTIEALAEALGVTMDDIDLKGRGGY